jgi:hypothetical protein
LEFKPVTIEGLTSTTSAGLARDYLSGCVRKLGSDFECCDSCCSVKMLVGDIVTALDYSEDVLGLSGVCLTVNFSIDMMCIKMFCSVVDCIFQTNRCVG